VPKIIRVRPGGWPASANARRVARSDSASLSSTVSTPSGRMPSSSHSSATPPPLPIDTTVRAAAPAARTARVAPTAGVTGGAPASPAARVRADTSAGVSAAKRSA
jgi:hypothetical protein